MHFIPNCIPYGHTNTRFNSKDIHFKLYNLESNLSIISSCVRTKHNYTKWIKSPPNTTQTFSSDDLRRRWYYYYYYYYRGFLIRCNFNTHSSETESEKVILLIPTPVFSFWDFIPTDPRHLIAYLNSWHNNKKKILSRLFFFALHFVVP